MKSRYCILSIPSCISIMLIISLTAGIACKKQEDKKQEKPVRAIATFVIGKVILERPGEPSRPVLHKDELRTGDVVKTGHDSILVVQLGGESLIKIEANTTVRVSSFMEQGATKFELAQGTMFNRVRNLNKESSYMVQTKTSLAAVRGTVFSVSSGKDKSVVAVSNGAVNVQGTTKKNEVTEEKIVEQGNAAVVKNKITTRPVTGDEKKEFNKFEKIAAVGDIDSTSESELKEMEAEYLKNDDKAGEKKAVPTSSGKDKPAGEDITKKALAWTCKRVYGASDDIVVYYKNLPEYRNCWIDISKSSNPEGRYQSYNWTHSAKNGQMTFSRLRLEPGAYEVRVHFSKSNTVNKRFPFRVQ